MEAIDCLNGRRSVRKFTDAHIDRETVSKIVLAAQAAPSWKNMQPTRFTAMYGDAVAQVHKLFREENASLGTGTAAYFQQPPCWWQFPP